MLAFLSKVFGVIAVVTAGIGVFALIAFTLARRTREVGIRVAVGATPQHIAALFGHYAAGAVLPGIFVGVGVFSIAKRGLEPYCSGPARNYRVR